ncbi:MAG TPA: CopG family ribbon-helix-helix protein [Candidatus Bathyarchaeia archaeon]|nr:CopG family ribbon-helix-helix protein [Candidatus Bathyarchaeia archaeon]
MIVSLSFPDELVKQLDQIQEAGGFAGRSELVRTAIRLLIEDTKEKNSLKGRVAALVVVTHDQEDENPITMLKHQFESIVKTHIHSKISPNNCVELFLLEGDGSKIGSMTRAFQKEEKMKSVKLVLI